MGLSFTGIIPARYGSKRFPGKPLAMVDGVPMVIRVWQNVSAVLDDVYIATDSNEVQDLAVKAGANVIMTSDLHRTGTERVAEAAGKIFDEINSDTIVLNIQGDEPLLGKKEIKELCNEFVDEKVKIATLIGSLSDLEEFHNPNRPKVTLDSANNALYFSRSPIPNISFHEERDITEFYKHIGVYAFRLDTLMELIKLTPSKLELAENLEQLRWLENGFKIRCIVSGYEGLGVDTEEDLTRINKILREKSI